MQTYQDWLGVNEISKEMDLMIKYLPVWEIIIGSFSMLPYFEVVCHAALENHNSIRICDKGL